MTLSDRLADLLRHSSAQLFAEKVPNTLAVAVSGGGDSMALLDLMHWHGKQYDFSVVAVSVDHGLRAAAADELAQVGAYCSNHGIDHHILHWKWDGHGNLQAKAREARYSLISSWALAHGIDQVALGHTQDDVAETFLMRLARGAGVDGLSHMARRFERNHVMWIRPVTRIPRERLRTYLRQHAIEWSDDPTNDDAAFERVRARQVLTALSPLGIDSSVLEGVAENLSRSSAALESYTIEAARSFVSVDFGDVILPSRAGAPGSMIPEDVLFRLRRAALHFVAGGSYPPRGTAVESIEQALLSKGSHTLNGCLVTKTAATETHFETWRITREFNAVKDLVGPPEQLWDGRWQLTGPRKAGLEIRALGEAVKDTDWRATGLPRTSLIASPAVWKGQQLVAAPVAGLSNGWTAQLSSERDDFAVSLIRR